MRWLVVRDNSNRGLFLGWEFDEWARIRLTHDAAAGRLEIQGGPTELFHPVGPGESFLTRRRSG